MKPKIKGEQAQIGTGVFDDLFTRPLDDLDKTGFHHHVVEIEQMHKAGFPKKDWAWRKQILENYCQRTGVNMRLLLKFVTSKFWIHIQQALIEEKRI
jgi:hypothetical protein